MGWLKMVSGYLTGTLFVEMWRKVEDQSQSFNGKGQKQMEGNQKTTKKERDKKKRTARDRGDKEERDIKRE